MSEGVTALYKNFGVLADAQVSDISQHSLCYKSILQAAKGSVGEKRLAPGFITKFFRYFPSLHDAAIDAILDLIEDDDSQIRRLAIKSLTDICKGGTDDSLYVRVSDVLTQLLPIEDEADLGLVKSSLAAVLQMNTKVALVGLFDQIMSDDESVRDKGIKYVSGPLMDMRQKIFVRQPDNEKCLLQLVKKVLVDVTGEEFEVLMAVVSKLSYISTPEGSKELVALISQQADLSSPFKAEDTEALDKFTTCYRQALKYSKHGCAASEFSRYICEKIFPVMDQIKEDPIRQELLQLLAEACLLTVEADLATSCTQPVYDYLLRHLPLPPEATSDDQPKLQFSTVECLLFIFLKFSARVTAGFLTSPEHPTRLKDLRARLQYFARGCHAYHSQLTATLKDMSAFERKNEQNRLRAVALKMTANISTMIREFFHNPPSHNTNIILSWDAKKAAPLPQPPGKQRKRPSSEEQAPAKRKHSPIHFDKPTSTKKDAMSIYSPPKDRFSKKLGTGGTSFGEFVESGWRGGKGGGARGGKGSWREY